MEWAGKATKPCKEEGLRKLFGSSKNPTKYAKGKALLHFVFPMFTVRINRKVPKYAKKGLSVLSVLAVKKRKPHRTLYLLCLR